jgi:hypothetical protein
MNSRQRRIALRRAVLKNETALNRKLDREEITLTEKGWWDLRPRCAGITTVARRRHTRGHR